MQNVIKVCGNMGFILTGIRVEMSGQTEGVSVLKDIYR